MIEIAHDTADHLMDLIKIAPRGSISHWALSRPTLQMLYLVKTTAGRYAFDLGSHESLPPTLCGFLVVTDNSLPERAILLVGTTGDVLGRHDLLTPLEWLVARDLADRLIAAEREHARSFIEGDGSPLPRGILGDLR